jgi:WD40 repeat protein
LIGQSTTENARADINKKYTAAQLALQAQSLKDRDPAALELSALLAIESLSLVPSADADHTARMAIALLRKPFKQVPHGKLISALALSADGKWLATASGVKQLHDDNQLHDDSQLHIEAVNSHARLAPRSHTGPISHVAFSPDHPLIASASAQTVRIFDIADPSLVRTVKLNDSVLSISFRRNHRLAIGSRDGRAEVIDASNGVPIARFPPSKGLRFVTLDSTGRTLATAAGKLLHLFDVESQRELSYSPLRHTGTVRMVAFSPDNSLVGTASEDGAVEVFNTLTGVQVTKVSPTPLPAYHIVFSDDNRLVAAASGDNYVRVFRVDPECMEVFAFKHQGPITFIGFAHSGDLLITGSTDRTVRVFETNSGNEIARMVHPAPVTAVAFDERSGTIATASAGLARLYNDFSRAPDSVALGKTIAITHTAFNGSEKVVVASGTKVLVLSKTGEPLREVPTLGVPATHLAFSNDARSIAVSLTNGLTKLEHDGIMHIIGNNSTQERRSVAGLAFSGDNARLAVTGNSTNSAGQDQAYVRTFNSSDGTEVGMPKFCAGKAQAVALSRDHELVAVGTSERACIFLPRAYIPVDDRSVSAIAFNSTNSLVAIGAETGRLEVFDLKGKSVFVSDEREGAVSDIFFIDENTVAALTIRGITQFFNVREGKALVHLPNSILAFGLLGKQLLTLSQDHAGFFLQTHKIVAPELIEQACSTVSRNLLAAEWRLYVGSSPYHKTCAKVP